MDILLEQIKQVNKPQVYLTFLETLCGDLPDNRLEVVLDNPLAMGGWARQKTIDDTDEYQLRMLVGDEDTGLIVPLRFVEQLHMAYDIRDGFLYHMTHLERIEAIRRWVAMWRFCTHCAQAGFSLVQNHRAFGLRRDGVVHELVMLRNITNSLGQERWWVVLRNEKQKFGLRLRTPDWGGKERPFFVTQWLQEALHQRLYPEYTVTCLD